MKVATISFHRAINYGAVLQVYALMKTISKMDHECTVLDYRCKKLENDYKCNSLKDFVRLLVIGRDKKKVKNKFEHFRNTYLKLSKPYYNLGELSTTNEIYDNFICGSDQVWNYAGSGFDKAYFLDFVEDNSKKNSYAASFGFSFIPQEYLKKYKNLLCTFNNISVREKQGAEIIKDLLGKKVETVLDPTLLLSKEEWYKLSLNYQNKKEYILLYVFELTPTIKTFTENLANETGCEIIFISLGIKKNIHAYHAKDVGPQEFLGLFRNAKYVVTNSFHGTAFSINFDKEFFIELLNKSAKVNSRLENILDTFDLRSRQIINGNNDNIFNEIDYTTVNKKLELERQRSLDYLQRIFEK